MHMFSSCRILTCQRRSILTCQRKSNCKALWTLLMQEEGAGPDAATLASEGVQDCGADVQDLMAQLQSLM
jgi:hypothetical protein